MPNPIIQYISRTYNTIMADIDAVVELRDKPSWWKKIWAGVGDVLSMTMNAVANQSYLATSFTDAATDRLLQLIDYQRTEKTTSSGNLLFYVNRSATFPFTVAVANLVAYSSGGSSVASKRFEGIAAQTFTASLDNFTTTHAANTATVGVSYVTGDLLRLTTTGTLPAATGGGLSTGTDYYAIRVNATTIKFARTLADAYNGTNIDLTDNGSGTHTIHLYSKSVLMYQQTSFSSRVIGTSNGVTEWQEFDLPDKDVIKTTVEIVVNSVTYTRVDTFVYSGVADTHYKLFYRTDGSAYIRFGNGTYGAIPPAFAVYAAYATGGGIDSNVSTQNTINLYGGSDSNISGVSNSALFTGGADRQTSESAKLLAPVLLKTRDRFVTVEDGEALVLAYGGVSRCAVNKNVYGILSAQVVIVPDGGGSPSSALKSALDTYLTNRSILESIDIRVVDPVYVSTNVTVQVKVESGYLFANISDYCELACYLFISEKTNEIKTLLTNSGIAAAVTYINATWTYTFSDVDYTQVQTLIEQSRAVGFGDSVQQSTLFALLESYVEGVDYVTSSAPSFPVTLGTDEITTENTITVTEI